MDIERITELQITEYFYYELKKKIHVLKEEAYGMPGEEYVCDTLLNFIEAIEND